MKKSIIVEGNSIINHLVETKKEEVQNKPNDVVFRFTQHIRELLSKYSPDNILIILPLESSMSTEESGAINKIMMSMGINTANYQANLIGYHINSIRKKIEGEVSISSLSSSILQLINENTEVIRFDTQEILTKSSLPLLIGLRPDQIKDLVAMSGDSDFGIDTIIGHKMAIEWLKSHGTIEGIRSNSGLMNKAMRNIFDLKYNDIIRQRSISDFSNLDSLSDEIEVSEIKRNPVNISSLHKQYIENKLFEWLPSDLRELHAPKTNFNSDITYTIKIESDTDRDEFANKINEEKGISFNLIGNLASFSQKKGESFVLDILQSENLKLVKKILSSDSYKIVAHDAKELMHWGRKNMINVSNIVSDSAILAYTINTFNSEEKYSSLAKKVLGIKIKTLDKESKEDDKIRIAGESSDLILRLNRKLYEISIADGRARYIFEKLELPMIKTLFEIESKGVYIDTEKLKYLEKEFEEKNKKIEKTINDIAKKEISLTNPKDVAHYVFDIIKMKESEHKKSARSTSESCLLEFVDLHETISMILEHRKSSKLLSTYIKPYISSVNNEKPRIYANFMQNVTSTSRLSARNPNLQAIPIRSDDGRKIREAFSAPEGSCIVAVDYSQIELRILAHLSQDKSLIEAFRNGMDIHLATAASVFNIPPSEVTGEQRRAAKAINFGIVYKMTPYGLANKLNCTPEKASEFIDSYFNRFPGVKAFLDNTIIEVKKTGYLTTMIGRKLFHPDVNSQDFKTRSSAERSAVNSPMQGSASDIIKIAMIKIAKMTEKLNLKTKMVMQVHDELVFEVPNNELEFVYEKIISIMENSVTMLVPLKADAGVGKDWASSHTLEQFRKKDDEALNMI